MINKLAALVLPQLDELIIKFDQLQKRTKYRDFSDISTSEASEFITAGMSTICRIAGPKSEYAQQIDQYIKHHLNHPTLTIPHVGGALKALRRDVASGYLISIQELIHANIFADFLEMAEHLLGEGYKDAAAVMIGGVLEEHLRKLSHKHSIQLDFVNSKGVSQPKKADTLNAELASNTNSLWR